MIGSPCGVTPSSDAMCVEERIRQKREEGRATATIQQHSGHLIAAMGQARTKGFLLFKECLVGNKQHGV